MASKALTYELGKGISLETKYRGKILAILPLSKDYTKNQDFLKLIKDNNMIEEVIKSKAIQ